MIEVIMKINKFISYIFQVNAPYNRDQNTDYKKIYNTQIRHRPNISTSSYTETAADIYKVENTDLIKVS